MEGIRRFPPPRRRERSGCRWEGLKVPKPAFFSRSRLQRSDSPFIPSEHMRVWILSLAALSLLAASTKAEQILEGYSVVKGSGYAFEVKAPLGWILDNSIGLGQGLNIVFYPKDFSWDNSPGVCFARVKTLDSEIKSISDQVQATLAAYRAAGSPGVEANYINTFTTQDASKAKVFYYTGLKAGAQEASAYIQAKGSIHYVTLSCRSRDAFNLYLPAFHALVTSYEDLTKPPTIDPNPPTDKNW